MLFLQVILTLVLIFGLVVLPLVGIMTQEIDPEDFQRDVKKGL